MSLDGLREQRQRPPHGWAGTILDDATTLQDEVRVTLDAFRDSRRPHGPMPFLPGSVLPNEGDRCLVMFDEARRPCVVWWATEESLPGGGGGGAPSGPAGGVLSGTYPDPGFAVDMATQAEVDLALAGKQPLHANLTAFAGLTGAADRLAYFTGAGTLAVVTFTAAARALLDDADAAAMRTTLGLLSMATQDASAVAITGGTVTGITDLAVADGGTGASTPSAARTNLGAQAQDTDLDAIAALTSAANKVPYATGAGTWALADLTLAARNLLDDADAAAMRTTLGLVIGTDVQAQDAQLAAIAGLTPANDQIIYWTGATSAAMTALTPTARSLLDDTSIGAMRTTLDVPSNAEAILDTLIDAKGDVLAGTAADTVARVPVGADGQVLTADSASTPGIKWAAAAGGGIAATIVDAKGDLIAATAADTVARLAVGADRSRLVADSSQATGLKWEAQPYTVVLQQGALRGAGVGTGLLWFMINGTAVASGAGSAGNLPAFLKIATASTEWPSQTVFNLLVSLVTTATQTGVTLKFGLYPVTITGTTSVVFTLGTVVAGSEVTFTAPTSGSENVLTSGDFTIPAADTYIIGCNQSAGTTAASSQTVATGLLRAR